MTKKALVGLHQKNLIPGYKIALETSNYDVTLADSVDDMLLKMGVQSSTTNLDSRLNRFDLYLMDVNFGKPAIDTYGPAQTIYDKMQGTSITFIAITARLDLVINAKKAGIPCYDKLSDASKILDLLLEKA